MDTLDSLSCSNPEEEEETVMMACQRGIWVLPDTTEKERERESDGSLPVGSSLQLCVCHIWITVCVFFFFLRWAYKLTPWLWHWGFFFVVMKPVVSEDANIHVVFVIRGEHYGNRADDFSKEV